MLELLFILFNIHFLDLYSHASHVTDLYAGNPQPKHLKAAIPFLDQYILNSCRSSSVAALHSSAVTVVKVLCMGIIYKTSSR